MSRIVSIKCDTCQHDCTAYKNSVFGFRISSDYKDKKSGIESVDITLANQHICKECLRKLSEFYESVKYTKEQT